MEPFRTHAQLLVETLAANRMDLLTFDANVALQLEIRDTCGSNRRLARVHPDLRGSPIAIESAVLSRADALRLAEWLSDMSAEA